MRWPGGWICGGALPERPLLSRFLRKTTQHDERMREVARWGAMFLIGVVIALCAFIIDISLLHLSDWKLHLVAKGFDRCAIPPCSRQKKIRFVTCDGALTSRPADRSCVSETCLVEPFGTWLAINVGCVAIAVFVGVYAAPYAAGSGIPEVKAYLNGIKMPQVVR